MDLSTLFQDPIRPPARAPRRSLRCRAFTSYGERCTQCIAQHDGTCWSHADYYDHWWLSLKVKSIDEYWSMMLHREKEIDFQVGGGFVSFDDPDFDKLIRSSPIHLFLKFCGVSTFRAERWPELVSAARHYCFKSFELGTATWTKAFEPLLRQFDIGHVFNLSFPLILRLAIARSHRSYMIPDQLTAILNSIPVQYKDVAYMRKELYADLEYFELDVLRDICIGRVVQWLSRLKEADKAMDPLREEIVAAGWAPERMPFWCLDIEEIADLYPYGLPSKEEHVACVAACS